MKLITYECSPPKPEFSAFYDDLFPRENLTVNVFWKVRM